MIAYEPRGSVTDAELERLEDRLGRRLPDDYRGWLRDNDGAWLDTLGLRGGVVNRFLGVLDTDGGGGLAQLNRTPCGGFASWVPDEWLVASDGSGGVVCVKVTGDGIASVWWADYDLAEEIAPRDERENDPLPQIMERLADSWTRFLADYEDPPLPPEFLAYLDSLTPQDP